MALGCFRACWRAAPIARMISQRRWLLWRYVVAKLEILAGGCRQHRLSRPGTAWARLRGLLDDGAPSQLLVADPRCRGVFRRCVGAYMALALHVAAYQAHSITAAVSGGGD